MKGSTWSIIFSLLTTACIGSIGHTSGVIELTSDDFEGFMSQHDLILTKFIAPSCQYCTELQPEYDEAAVTLKEKNITLATVDCIAQSELCKDHHIGIYPTLYVFRGLDDMHPYRGPRKAVNIISYMNKQSLPTVSDLNTKNIGAFKSAEKVVVIAFDQGTRDDNEWKDTFTSIARSMQNENLFLFGFTDDPELAKAEGISQGAGIVLYKQFDDGKEVYCGDLDKEAIETFINRASLPLLDEVDRYLINGYIKAGIPLALFFAETREERAELAKNFKPLADRYKSKISIATADIKELAGFGRGFGLEVDKGGPAFGIRDLESDYQMSIDQGKELVEEDVSQVIEAFLAGREEQTSEESTHTHNEL